MKKNIENLSKTYPIKPDLDQDGYYILYCDYERHPGVVIPKQRKICEEEDCIHLIKFRDDRYLI